jgi:LemA protein
MTPILILGGILLVLVGYVITTYNFFQQALVRIEASIQEIGNQLKRQASLIPNLIESSKAYLTHEKDIFDKLVSARKAVESAQAKGGAAIDKAVSEIQGVLPQLQILVEDNPELKADNIVQKLMDELRDTSDKLMYARRTLIDLTADYNQKLVMFPSSIIASIFKFSKQKGLETPSSGAHIEVSEAETKDVEVKL